MEKADQERQLQDLLNMSQAYSQAEQGLGGTSPNPPVGAVIVGQGGELLGLGYHKKAGTPHAERVALADALENGFGDKLKGSTIYVTLEPCSSYGRTPPCTDAIIQAGISRVVYGSVDPDKRHQGRADAILRAAGIEVQGGVLKGSCDRLLRPWMHSLATGRPWVLAKTACTLDGRLTRATDRWLSGKMARTFVHDLRFRSDAILVGGNTVRVDDPALTIRHSFWKSLDPERQPWRIVLTNDRAKLPARSQLFTDAHADRTLVFERVGDLTGLLETLYREYGIVNLMLECGGHLLRLFLEQGLVNEWVQVITPIIGGGPDHLLPGAFLPAERRFEREQHIPMGADLVLRGVIR